MLFFTKYSKAYNITATPALSSPPRVVLPSVFIIFPSSMIFTPLLGSTTSICAERVIAPFLLPFNTDNLS